MVNALHISRPACQKGAHYSHADRSSHVPAKHKKRSGYSFFMGAHHLLGTDNSNRRKQPERSAMDNHDEKDVPEPVARI